MFGPTSIIPPLRSVAGLNVMGVAPTTWKGIKLCRPAENWDEVRAIVTAFPEFGTAFWYELARPIRLEFDVSGTT